MRRPIVRAATYSGAAPEWVAQEWIDPLWAAVISGAGDFAFAVRLILGEAVLAGDAHNDSERAVHFSAKILSPAAIWTSVRPRPM